MNKIDSFFKFTEGCGLPSSFLKNNRIKRLGRDDLNYQANPPKVHRLRGTKDSFSFLASNKL